jgi:hypothetical protein
MTLRPSTILYPVYGPAPSVALYLLYDHMSPLRPSTFLKRSVLLMALCPLYGPWSPLQLYVLSSILCALFSPLSPLQPYVPSTALCLLYCPLSSVLSMALCPLYGHSVLSTNLSLLHSHPSHLKP